MSIPEETKPLTETVGALARSYAKGQRIAAHQHDWHQLIHASAGVMTITTAAGTWVVPPQRAVWMPAGIEHAIRCASAISMRTLYIAPEAEGVVLDRCSVVQVTPLLRELVVRAVEAPGPPERRRLLAALIVAEIGAAALAPLHLPEPVDRRLRRITDALRAEPGDRRTLAEWAADAGASRRTLSRLFLAETGMTFRQWQRQLRLLTALVRLAQRTPVTTVALDLGYDSPSAFINAFRRALGTTPGRYFDAQT